MLLDDHLRKEQLASELGCSTRKLDRLELRGDGPPKVRIGRTVLYRKDSVLEWLKSRESKRVRRGR